MHVQTLHVSHMHWSPMWEDLNCLEIPHTELYCVQCFSVKEAWIGLHFPNNQQRPFWNDGYSLDSYKLWKNGQVDHSSHSCVSTTLEKNTGDLTWKTNKCTSKHAFVCHYAAGGMVIIKCYVALS